ncbi:GNAT family N-acetyltransferase [Aeromicrobium sp.]|uniref:GNAT family N-acetyltransferase n=1 Tax=Aeromicrobium sp. TaxID=1871063 RepID=UPI003D6C40BE
MTTIERVDIGDEETFGTFYDVYERSHERDIDHPYSAIEKRVGLRPDGYVDKIALLARDDDGTPVAGGTVELPLRDNTDFVYVDAFTVPEHRRRGHAGAVIEAIEEIARDAGRQALYTEVVWELVAVDPVPQAFAEACGFRLDIMDAIRELALPAELPPLRVAEGYTIHSWRDVCPDEWVQGYTELRRLLMEEAPRGDVELENEFWDVARTREEEQMWVEQGRTPQVSIAVSDDGEVVGHTQLVFSAGRESVFQWDTLVLPTHRGHGLGLALKVTTMQKAADLLQGRRRIITYNAAGNEPMIRVNAALGFVQTAWCAEYVKEL